MNSSLFSVLNEFLNSIQRSNPISHKSVPNWFLSRSLYTGRYSSTNLQSRINNVGDPNTSVAPVLNQWVEKGNKVRSNELQGIIRGLRRRKRYKQALEVSEWMSNRGHIIPFSSENRALQLDLVGKVLGLNAAESYFNKLSDQDKCEKMYGALLNCYAKEGLTDEALSHVQKMKEMGYLSNPLVYNNIMSIYVHAGLLEKVPEFLSEMKEHGIPPNEFSYRICISSYGSRSELTDMEKLLTEMESQPQISTDWRVYAIAANFYIKAGNNEKAIVALKKSEEKLSGNTVGYNNLISFYATLGNKAEVMRLWGIRKSIFKKQSNIDYMTVLGSLVKLGELEEAGGLLKEWESSYSFYDFRVPNVILIGYCQKGLVEKAEVMLRDIVENGKTPIPNSWGILASGYLSKGNMGKAVECMNNALAIRVEGYLPKPHVVSSILSWLGDNREVEEVEAFVSSLKAIVPMDKEMYIALIKAHVRCGKGVDAILDSMKADKIEEDEELEKILSFRLRKLDYAVTEETG